MGDKEEREFQIRHKSEHPAHARLDDPCLAIFVMEPKVFESIKSTQTAGPSVRLSYVCLYALPHLSFLFSNQDPILQHPILQPGGTDPLPEMNHSKWLVLL